MYRPTKLSHKVVSIPIAITYFYLYSAASQDKDIPTLAYHTKLPFPTYLTAAIHIPTNKFFKNLYKTIVAQKIPPYLC